MRLQLASWSEPTERVRVSVDDPPVLTETGLLMLRSATRFYKMPES